MDSVSPEMLTVLETAALLRVSRKTVYEAVRAKTLPGVVRVGAAIRVNRRILLAWMNGEKAA